MTKHKRDKARKRHNKVVRDRNIGKHTPTGIAYTSPEPVPIEATPEEIQEQKEELAKGGY